VKIEDLQHQDRNLLQKNDNLSSNQVKNEIADQVNSFPVANKFSSHTTELVVVVKIVKCESKTDNCNKLSSNENLLSTSSFATNITPSSYKCYVPKQHGASTNTAERYVIKHLKCYICNKNIT